VRGLCLRDTLQRDGSGRATVRLPLLIKATLAIFASIATALSKMSCLKKKALIVDFYYQGAFSDRGGGGECGGGCGSGGGGGGGGRCGGGSVIGRRRQRRMRRRWMRRRRMRRRQQQQRMRCWWRWMDAVGPRSFYFAAAADGGPGCARARPADRPVDSAAQQPRRRLWR
jgi:hypothetical protein